MKKSRISINQSLILRLVLGGVFLALPLVLSAQTLWEGSAAVGSYGVLPVKGLYGASNSFSRNTVVEVENLENGKKTEIIIVDRLEKSGFLLLLSQEAGASLGVSSGNVVRIRATLGQEDKINSYALSDEQALHPDPDVNPAMSAEKTLGQQKSGALLSLSEYPTERGEEVSGEDSFSTPAGAVEQNVAQPVSNETVAEASPAPAAPVAPAQGAVQTPSTATVAEKRDVLTNPPVEDPDHPVVAPEPPLSVVGVSHPKEDPSLETPLESTAVSDAHPGVYRQVEEVTTEEPVVDEGVSSVVGGWQDAAGENPSLADPGDLPATPEFMPPRAETPEEYSVTVGPDRQMPYEDEMLSVTGDLALPVAPGEDVVEATPEAEPTLNAGREALIGPPSPDGTSGSANSVELPEYTVEQIEPSSLEEDLPRTAHPGPGEPSEGSGEAVDGIEPHSPAIEGDAELVLIPADPKPPVVTSKGIDNPEGEAEGEYSLAEPVSPIDGSAEGTVAEDDFLPTALPDVLQAPGDDQLPSGDVSTPELVLESPVLSEDEPDLPKVVEGVTSPGQTEGRIDVVAPEVNISSGETETAPETETVRPVSPGVVSVVEDNTPPVTAVEPAPVVPAPVKAEESPVAVVVEERPATVKLVEDSPRPAQAEPTRTEPAKELPAQAYRSAIPVVNRLQPGYHYIQVGVFGDQRGASAAIARLEPEYPVLVWSPQEGSRDLYKVMVGPLMPDESGTLLYLFKASGYADAFLRKK